MQFPAAFPGRRCGLSVACTAVASSGPVKKMAPCNAIGAKHSPFLFHAQSRKPVLLLLFCAVGQQINPWISVNLTSVVGGDYCQKLTKVVQVCSVAAALTRQQCDKARPRYVW